MSMAKPLVEALDPDLPLFEALRAGDESVVPELMARHGRWVRGVVYASIGRAEDIEDVCQQVWLTVWRRSRSLQDVSRWRYWLYRTARNAAIDAGRRITRQRTLWQKFTGIVRTRPDHAENDGPRTLLIQERYRAA